MKYIDYLINYDDVYKGTSQEYIVNSLYNNFTKEQKNTIGRDGLITALNKEYSFVDLTLNNQKKKLDYDINFDEIAEQQKFLKENEFTFMNKVNNSFKNNNDYLLTDEEFNKFLDDGIFTDKINNFYNKEREKRARQENTNILGRGLEGAKEFAKETAILSGVGNITLGLGTAPTFLGRQAYKRNKDWKIENMYEAIRNKKIGNSLEEINEDYNKKNNGRILRVLGKVGEDWFFYGLSNMLGNSVINTFSPSIKNINLKKGFEFTINVSSKIVGMYLSDIFSNTLGINRIGERENLSQAIKEENKQLGNLLEQALTLEASNMIVNCLKKPIKDFYYRAFYNIAEKFTNDGGKATELTFMARPSKIMEYVFNDKKREELKNTIEKAVEKGFIGLEAPLNIKKKIQPIFREQEGEETTNLINNIQENKTSTKQDLVPLNRKYNVFNRPKDIYYNYYNSIYKLILDYEAREKNYNQYISSNYLTKNKLNEDIKIINNENQKLDYNIKKNEDERLKDFFINTYKLEEKQANNLVDFYRTLKDNFKSQYNISLEDELKVEYEDKENKAQAYYDTNKNLIKLYKNSNFSSFIHEIGHFYIHNLERYKDNELVKPTYNIMNKYVNEYGEENIVRAFELFLLNNEIDNPALHHIFNDISSNLNNLYLRNKLYVNTSISEEQRQKLFSNIFTKKEIKEDKKQLQNVYTMSPLTYSQEEKENKLKLIKEETSKLYEEAKKMEEEEYEKDLYVVETTKKIKSIKREIVEKIKKQQLDKETQNKLNKEKYELEKELNDYKQDYPKTLRYIFEDYNNLLNKINYLNNKYVDVLNNRDSEAIEKAIQERIRRDNNYINEPSQEDIDFEKQQREQRLKKIEEEEKLNKEQEQQPIQQEQQEKEQELIEIVTDAIDRETINTIEEDNIKLEEEEQQLNQEEKELSEEEKKNIYYRGIDIKEKYLKGSLFNGERRVYVEDMSNEEKEIYEKYLKLKEEKKQIKHNKIKEEDKKIENNFKEEEIKKYERNINKELNSDFKNYNSFIKYNILKKNGRIAAYDIINKEIKSNFNDDNTKKKIKSFLNYTMDYYENINNYLRFGEIKEELNYKENNLKKDIKNIDNNIEKTELKNNIKVFRGEIINDDRLKKIKEAYKNGDLLNFKGYTSTSFSKEDTERFTDNSKNGYIYEIDIKKGKGKGKYLDETLAESIDEYEFLIKRNSFFKIKNIDEENKIIHLEMLEEPQEEIKEDKKKYKKLLNEYNNIEKELNKLKDKESKINIKLHSLKPFTPKTNLIKKNKEISKSNLISKSTITNLGKTYEYFITKNPKIKKYNVETTDIKEIKNIFKDSFLNKLNLNSLSNNLSLQHMQINKFLLENKEELKQLIEDINNYNNDLRKDIEEKYKEIDKQSELNYLKNKEELENKDKELNNKIKELENRQNKIEEESKDLQLKESEAKEIAGELLDTNKFVGIIKYIPYEKLNEEQIQQQVEEEDNNKYFQTAFQSAEQELLNSLEAAELTEKEKEPVEKAVKEYINKDGKETEEVIKEIEKSFINDKVISPVLNNFLCIRSNLIRYGGKEIADIILKNENEFLYLTKRLLEDGNKFFRYIDNLNLSEEETIKLNLAMFNGAEKAVREIINNDNVVNDYKKNMDLIWKLARENGIEMGYIKDFYLARYRNTDIEEEKRNKVIQMISKFSSIPLEELKAMDDNQLNEELIKLSKYKEFLREVEENKEILKNYKLPFLSKFYVSSINNFKQRTLTLKEEDLKDYLSAEQSYNRYIKLILNNISERKLIGEFSVYVKQFFKKADNRDKTIIRLGDLLDINKLKDLTEEEINKVLTEKYMKKKIPQFKEEVERKLNQWKFIIKIFEEKLKEKKISNEEYEKILYELEKKHKKEYWEKWANEHIEEFVDEYGEVHIGEKTIKEFADNTEKKYDKKLNEIEKIIVIIKSFKKRKSNLEKEINLINTSKDIKNIYKGYYNIIEGWFETYLERRDNFTMKAQELNAKVKNGDNGVFTILEKLDLPKENKEFLKSFLDIYFKKRNNSIIDKKNKEQTDLVGEYIAHTQIFTAIWGRITQYPDILNIQSAFPRIKTIEDYKFLKMRPYYKDINEMFGRNVDIGELYKDKDKNINIKEKDKNILGKVLKGGKKILGAIWEGNKALNSKPIMKKLNEYEGAYISAGIEDYYRLNKDNLSQAEKDFYEQYFKFIKYETDEKPIMPYSIYEHISNGLRTNRIISKSDKNIKGIESPQENFLLNFQNKFYDCLYNIIRQSKENKDTNFKTFYKTLFSRAVVNQMVVSLLQAIYLKVKYSIGGLTSLAGEIFKFFITFLGRLGYNTIELQAAKQVFILFIVGSVIATIYKYGIKGLTSLKGIIKLLSLLLNKEIGFANIFTRKKKKGKKIKIYPAPI